MKKISAVITGPAGSGKSTIAVLLAKTIKDCVNIEVDQVKHFIVNGFVYDNSEKGLSQWQLLGKLIGDLARSYQAEGYNVIINGYLNETALKEIKAHTQLTHKVLLLPELSESQTRDSNRDKNNQMGLEAINVHHAYFSDSEFYRDFTIIDSSGHEPNETVEQLKQILNTS